MTKQTPDESRKATKNKGILPTFLGVGIFIFMTIVVARSCGSNAGRNAADKLQEKEAQLILGTHEDSYSEVVQVDKAGLTMRLPKKLASLSEERSSGGKFQSIEQYTSVFTTRSVVIKRFVFNGSFEVNASEAADMYEADMKSQPGYRSTRKSVGVSWLEGILLNAHYEGMGHKVEQSILYFSKGDEFWEVQLFGVDDDNPESLRMMKDMIFSSVQLKS